MKIDVIANPASVSILPKGEGDNPLAFSVTLSFDNALVLADRIKEAVKIGRKMVILPPA